MLQEGLSAPLGVLLIMGTYDVHFHILCCSVLGSSASWEIWSVDCVDAMVSANLEIPVVDMFQDPFN